MMPPPLSDKAKALREAEIAGGFEGKMIFAANCAVVFLIVVVLVCTLLAAAPDKPPKGKRKEAPRAKDGRYTAAEVAKHSSAVRALGSGSARRAR